jgi:hypothetical protein
VIGLGFTDAQTRCCKRQRRLLGWHKTDGRRWRRRSSVRACQADWGSTAFFVRTAKEWQAIIDANSFPVREAKDDPSHLLAVILKDEVSGGERGLRSRRPSSDGKSCAQKDDVCTSVFPDGIGRSKLNDRDDREEARHARNGEELELRVEAAWFASRKVRENPRTAT